MDAATQQVLRESLEELLIVNPHQLVERIIEQAILLGQLRAEVAQLKAQIERLSTQPPGGAAPFRRPEARRVAYPKRPGRPAGRPAIQAATGLLRSVWIRFWRCL